MHNRRAFLSLSLVVAASSFAVPTFAGSPRTAPGRSNPPEFVAQLDGPVSTATAPDGRLWAVWSLRTPGEFDIAVSSRQADGTWSAPAYVGRRDRSDQIDPSIAIDANGTAYVAFATRSTGRVSIAVLLNGTTAWLGPVVVSEGERASAPTIRIVSDQVVVAYRKLTGVGIVNLPLLVPAQIQGVSDGPEGFDPLGMVPKWGPQQYQSDETDDDAGTSLE
jgi:hypothetical protein